MKWIVLLSTLTLYAHTLTATHNRAGYIRFEQLDALTVRAEIVTLTDRHAGPADRDSVTISWGDGHMQRIPRANMEGPATGDGLQRNIYIGEHTFAQKGAYTISLTDPTRAADILNINPPTSEETVFHIQTTVVLLDPTIEGLNRSPDLLHRPIDLALTDQAFTYQPNTFDADGDSITIELIVPLQGFNEPVPNYQLPHEVAANIGSTFTLQENIGLLTWDAPALEGSYGIALLITSYRQGKMIDATVLDMQIQVLQEDPTDLTGPQLSVADVTLYPNPTQENWIRVETTIPEPNWPYVIYNSSGSKIQTGKLTSSSSLVQLSDVPAGIYYLSVRQDNRVHCRTFQLLKR